jgi:hypothetical protein
VVAISSALTRPPRAAVVIVNQTTAKRFWGDADPLHTRFTVGDLTRQQIVGVGRRAANGVHGDTGDLLPEHRPDRKMGIVVRPIRRRLIAAGGPPEGTISIRPADVVVRRWTRWRTTRRGRG